MLSRTLLASALLFALTSTANAKPFGDHPFGFKEAMTYEEVKALEGIVITKDYIWDRKNVLELSKVPEQHPLFINYQLYFTEKQGLYAIVVYSDTIRIGKGGSNVMPAFISVRDEIAEHYGRNFYKSNYVEGGAAWETPTDWLARIHQKLRYKRNYSNAFVTSWQSGQLNTMPDGMSYLELRISLTGDPLYIVGQVEFHNKRDVK